MRPSEYVQRQVRATPYPHEDTGWTIANAGADVCMFSSDFPHVEGGRNPIARFERSMDAAGIDADARAPLLLATTSSTCSAPCSSAAASPPPQRTGVTRGSHVRPRLTPVRRSAGASKAARRAARRSASSTGRPASAMQQRVGDRAAGVPTQ